MTLDVLKSQITGDFWLVSQFEIEGLNVKSKWEQDNENPKNGWVTVKNFNLSDDNILDVFIHLTAPNRTEIKFNLTGKLNDAGAIKDIEYSEDFKVRNGMLRINFSKKISEIIK